MQVFGGIVTYLFHSWRTNVYIKISLIKTRNNISVQDTNLHMTLIEFNCYWSIWTCQCSINQSINHTGRSYFLFIQNLYNGNGIISTTLLMRFAHTSTANTEVILTLRDGQSVRYWAMHRQLTVQRECKHACQCYWLAVPRSTMSMIAQLHSALSPPTTFLNRTNVCACNMCTLCHASLWSQAICVIDQWAFSKLIMQINK